MNKLLFLNHGSSCQNKDTHQSTEDDRLLEAEGCAWELTEKELPAMGEMGWGLTAEKHVVYGWREVSYFSLWVQAFLAAGIAGPKVGHRRHLGKSEKPTRCHRVWERRWRPLGADRQSREEDCTWFGAHRGGPRESWARVWPSRMAQAREQLEEGRAAKVTFWCSLSVFGNLNSGRWWLGWDGGTDRAVDWWSGLRGLSSTLIF